jgi:ribose transport system ATP-binding protein
VLRLIVGRAVGQAFPAKAAGLPVTADAADAAGTAGAVPEPLLAGAGLSSARFAGVELRIAPGEIVGLAGVEGNGQRELLRSLAGLHPVTGEVRVAGAPVRLRNPGAALAAGIVYLPGDRHQEGLFVPLSVRENISALVLGRLSRLGLVQRARQAALARAETESLSIKTPGIETSVAVLSGGNQQKVVIARSLAARPRVLLADEPTRGVDAGARMEIYRMLRHFAAEGNAVVVASSDAIELQGLCDRVLVFSRGQVAASLTGAGLTERAITSAAITASATRQGVQPADGARFRASRFWKSDLAPSGILAVLIAGVAAYATSSNSLFLGTRNLTSLLLLCSVLAFAAAGQLTVLLVASIDLSVGPLMGLVVVVMSFFATTGRGMGGLGAGVAVALAVGAVVGLVNGTLIRLIRLPPVIATLITYIFLQGLSLLLRPQPAGYIDNPVTQALIHRIGAVPVAFIVAALLALACEWLLRRSSWGLELRAVGSDEARARRVGARVNGTSIAAHVLCSLLAVLGGIVLTAIVGVGDASLGTEYTLTSIAAVVLGGASIFGGRGSFAGALLGALLIQEVITATSFLGLADAWQEWLPGILILAGAGVYSRARARTAALIPGTGHPG